jgi:hypothetical protein
MRLTLALNNYIIQELQITNIDVSNKPCLYLNIDHDVDDTLQ